ncbi:MAG: AI-2E family transporter [Beijerinckiaceae bacterium]
MSEAQTISAEPPTKVGVAASPEASTALSLQVGVVVIAALYFGKEVLIPITLAILLSFVLAPLADLLRRAHLGRVLSVLLAVLIALGIILAIGGVIGSQVAQLANGIPQYMTTIEKKVDTVRTYTVGRIAELAGSIGRQAGSGETKPGVPPPSGAAGNAPANNAQSAGPAEKPSVTSSPLALAERYLSPVLSPLATLGIVFVVSIFALLQREDLRDRFIRLFGSTDLHRTTAALDDAARRLSRYFLTQLAINTTFGIVIGIGLFFIGVPNPVLWAIISGLLRFVPYIGSFISAGLPIALAAAVEPGWTMAISTAVLYVLIELLVSQAVEPVLYGHSTGLSPFAVVVSAIFWSWLWGPVGLILSMPLTLCLVVLGRHAERLEFLDIMLGDRAPLTPIESFYQRILAGDADEAEDHAEQLLKERSLSSYYDEVALKGLQLAANDAERGVLRPDQLERVKNTIKGLVAELATHGDKEPAVEPHAHKDATDPAAAARDLPKASPPAMADAALTQFAPAWRSGKSILCLAGKGPLDEAASAMLAQLLDKHGLGGRVTPYQAASREGITSLDVDGVAMVCISYLDISGSPSHLRYLLRRLRRRLPTAPILVGLWPAEDSALKDERIRAVIGADYYTSSLREAVNACVEAATKAAAPNAPAAPARVAAPA